MDGRYAGFAGAKTGHGLVALFGCFFFIFLSGAAFAAFSRRHIYPVFAVGLMRHSDEYAVIVRPFPVYVKLLAGQEPAPKGHKGKAFAALTGQALADTSDRCIEEQAVIDKILAHLIKKGALPPPPELLPAARASPGSDWLV